MVSLNGSKMKEKWQKRDKRIDRIFSGWKALFFFTQKNKRFNKSRHVRTLSRLKSMKRILKKVFEVIPPARRIYAIGLFRETVLYLFMGDGIGSKIANALFVWNSSAPIGAWFQYLKSKNNNDEKYVWIQGKSRCWIYYYQS